MKRRIFLRAGAGLMALGLVAACGETSGGDDAVADVAETSSTVTAVLDTTLGPIIVEVYPDAAPLSAGDFLAHLDQGLYDGAGFFRLVTPENDRGSPQIEVIQMQLAEGVEGLPPVAHETTEMTGLRHVDGALSLARGDVGTGSAGSFFITIGDQPGLDFGGMRNPDGQGFAVFGRVVEGMDVVRAIQARPTDPEADDDYVKGQILLEPVTFTAHRQ